MATSIDFYDGKSQEDFLPENEPKQQSSTTLTKLQEMEVKSKQRESFVLQQMKAARFDLNNCESIDETSHFEELLTEIHENVDKCQDLNSMIAIIHEEMKDEEKATKHKDNSKKLRNMLRTLEKDIFITIGRLHEPLKQDHESVVSEINEEKFDVLQGQDKQYNNVQNLMNNNHSDLIMVYISD